jgi:TatD DNase family protein
MQYIDTHTHLYLPEFDNDRDDSVSRAKQSGVIRMLMPNIDTGSVEIMMKAAERYKDYCLPMMGLHPTSVREDYLIQLEKLESIFPEYRYIAIGEIGIDLYWDKTYIKEQISAFRRQISFAIKNSLPVVVHARESFPEVFSVLEEFSGQGLTGVLHAFSGTAEDAERAVKIGFMLGIGGIVTFRNSGLDKVLEKVTPYDLLLETDSPYLAPAPHRGKRNESSYICIINKKIADIYRMKEEEIADITCRNSESLFNL